MSHLRCDHDAACLARLSQREGDWNDRFARPGVTVNAPAGQPSGTAGGGRPQMLKAKYGAKAACRGRSPKRPLPGSRSEAVAVRWLSRGESFPYSSDSCCKIPYSTANASEVPFYRPIATGKFALTGLSAARSSTSFTALTGQSLPYPLRWCDGHTRPRTIILRNSSGERKMFL